MTTDNLVTELFEYVRCTGEWETECPEREALVAALDRWVAAKINAHMRTLLSETSRVLRTERAGIPSL